MKKTVLYSILLLSSIFFYACTAKEGGEKNLSTVATPEGYPGFGPWISAINDGLTPTDSLGWMPRRGRRHRTMTQWVQLEWTQPVTTGKVKLFLWDYYGALPIPDSMKIKYWNGESFVPVSGISTDSAMTNRMNERLFAEVTTTILRIETDSAIFLPANIIEWEVIQAPGSPDIAPVVTAGQDRMVMKDGKTYLSGSVKSVTPVDRFRWTKISGPGKVSFSDPASLKGTAAFSDTGEYILALTAKEGKLKSDSKLRVKVVLPPAEERLNVVYTKPYKINNPLWNTRAKSLITSWIPHCIEMINRSDLEIGQGGIDNFVEAAKALRGEAHGEHKGYVFSNAWVYQTIESICIALMVDPQGDQEILAVHPLFKKTLDEWIPIVLSAQEPDGYIQTAYTLRDTTRWTTRWSPERRDTHEGYVAGYFIEAAINHYTLTNGTDTRLYDAAKKLADCWVANIGPGKNEWFDGHQEMEQALVRFGRFVNDMEGNGRGDAYINLARFLLDNRKDGSEYDQSHVPVQQQYEAVGHAVRAVYTYSGMADVAAETGDVDYQSAVMSLYDNMINKKYYVTGGIGSGETSEGFGPDYSLGNHAYCESCSSCGLIFFEYKMNLAYHDAKYADLYEETMYNALLGSVDLAGENFYYTNPLIEGRGRDPWHVCPCCVGNIPRTLLMVPTWTYVTGDRAIYVNLYNGSTIMVPGVAGTDIEMVQETDYPWSGNVTLTINPAESKEFTVFLRIPDRKTSVLYESVPAVKGLKTLEVNDEAADYRMDRGYAAITRKWEKGDKIELALPMEIQVITADEKIKADSGLVALRYGPLIYCAEETDNPDIDLSLGTLPLSTSWKGDLLDGVLTINGQWSDGSDMLAIPYYARQNRPMSKENDKRGRTYVWLKAPVQN